MAFALTARQGMQGKSAGNTAHKLQPTFKSRPSANLSR